MPTTKITSNILAPNAAQENLNAGNSITLTKAVNLSGDLTVDTNTFFVDSVNNRVGIGTTTPQTNFEVIATGTSSPIRISRTNNSTQKMGVAFVPAGTLSLVNPSWSFGVIQNSSTFTIDTWNGSSFGDVLAATSSGNVGVGTTTPNEKLTVSGNISATGTVTGTNLVYNTGDQSIAGDKTFTDDVSVVGQLTAPNQTLAGDSSTLTRGLLKEEMTLFGNEFGLAPVATSYSLNGGSGGANTTLGMHATITTSVSAIGAAYIGEDFWSHQGYAGTQMPSNKLIEATFNGVLMRVANDSTWKIRIGFGIGTATGRTPPLVDQPTASNRCWGVEFYYSGSSVKGKLFYYDTTLVWGDEFEVPAILTASSWAGFVYSIKMRQTAAGQLSIFMSTPNAYGQGTTRIPTTATSTLNATWTSNSLNGRYIGFEVVSSSTAGATGPQIRIHSRENYLRYVY